MKKESNLWHMKPGLLLQGRKEGLWPVVQVQLSFDWISISLLLRSLKFSFELCMIKEKSGFTFKSSFNLYCYIVLILQSCMRNTGGWVGGDGSGRSLKESISRPQLVRLRSGNCTCLMLNVSRILSPSDNTQEDRNLWR